MVSLYNKVLTVNGNTTIGADSLAWFWGDGTATPYTQPGTIVSHTYQQGGNYTVCLRAWNICGVRDSCFQVLNVGVNELVIQNPELVIYPNPFHDALNIELPENITDAQIALYDLVGKQVLNLNVTGNNNPKNITLDTGTLEPGIYIIHLVSKDGGRFVGKVVKN
ncbi:MAG: T9SS type A sorting domain-containing protein [Candidatus Moduliflexus flocculans]|nr:T9SS type A sorting domain-containing protein [Candidatus Moduliflexus flocculans]